MVGNIHSIETFGSVDGPGVRLVVFMQGCKMRCQYCHNPDTWIEGIGKNITPEEIIDRYLRNQVYYQNGGITVTGGEPLLQIDFLIELFILAKKNNIHTCIDTAGAPYDKDNPEQLEKLKQLLKYTDLVLLDIKHIDNYEHQKLTTKGNSNILEFAHFLEELEIPVWIRHVVVPTITDDEHYLTLLGEFIAKLHNVQSIDILGYHTLGKTKYLQLGLPEPLIGINDASEEELIRAKRIILEAIKKTKGN